MVSADSLNFDVLDLIFSYLSGHDLASVALVNRSFLAGVLPTLYKTVWYRLREGKAYTSVMSPFAVILKHSGLGVHVRSIDIESVPYTNTMKLIRQPHPTFMRECAKAMTHSRNLLAFKCTLPNVLPSFLIALQNKKRLQTLRIYANLTTEQTRLLSNISTLSSLVLEFASWNVIHGLPSWTTTLKNSLRSLTLYMTNELNTESLEAVLEQLPRLQGLHIVNCARVDHVAVLKLLKHTPELESLSFTTTENTCPLPLVPPLQSLRTLCIDARHSRTSSPVPSILQSILEYLKGTTCQLTSFSVKLPDRKVTIGHVFITRFLDAYGPSLKKLGFIDCSVDNETLLAICRKCIQLERLDIVIPIRDLDVFAGALSESRTLKTLVHVDNQHVHGLRSPLNQESVEQLMDSVGSLQTVVSDKRVWIRKDLGHGYVHAKIDRRLPAGPRSLWFLPSSKI